MTSGFVIFTQEIENPVNHVNYLMYDIFLNKTYFDYLVFIGSFDHAALCAQNHTHLGKGMGCLD